MGWNIWFSLAGHDTKALLNNRGPRYKRSKLERLINRDVLWSVVLLLLMCFLCALGKFSNLFLCIYIVILLPFPVFIKKSDKRLGVKDMCITWFLDVVICLLEPQLPVKFFLIPGPVSVSFYPYNVWLTLYGHCSVVCMAIFIVCSVCMGSVYVCVSVSVHRVKSLIGAIPR